MLVFGRFECYSLSPQLQFPTSPWMRPNCVFMTWSLSAGWATSVTPASKVFCFQCIIELFNYKCDWLCYCCLGNLWLDRCISVCSHISGKYYYNKDGTHTQKVFKVRPLIWVVTFHPFKAFSSWLEVWALYIGCWTAKLSFFYVVCSGGFASLLDTWKTLLITFRFTTCYVKSQKTKEGGGVVYKFRFGPSGINHQIILIQWLSFHCWCSASFLWITAIVLFVRSSMEGSGRVKCLATGFSIRQCLRSYGCRNKCMQSAFSVSLTYWMVYRLHSIR